MISWKEYHAKSDLGSRRMRVRDIVLTYLQSVKTANYSDIISHVETKTDIFPADLPNNISSVLYHLARGGYIEHTKFRVWSYVYGADTCTTAPAASTWVQYNARRNLAILLREDVPSIEDLIIRILGRGEEVRVDTIRKELNILTGIKESDMRNVLSYTLRRMQSRGQVVNTRYGHWKLPAEERTPVRWSTYTGTPIPTLALAIINENIEMSRKELVNVLSKKTGISKNDLHLNIGSVLKNLESQNKVYRVGKGVWRAVY